MKKLTNALIISFTCSLAFNSSAKAADYLLKYGQISSKPIILNQKKTEYQYDPVGVKLSDGRSVFLYSDSIGRPSNPDDAIRVRIFSKSGKPVGKETQIKGSFSNFENRGIHNQLGIVALPKSKFAVLYNEYERPIYRHKIEISIFNVSKTNEISKIATRRIGPDANLGSVNDNGEIAFNGKKMLATWTQEIGNDPGAQDIFAAVIDQSGKRIGKSFRVNKTRSGVQDEPDVAALSNGSFVVAWQEISGLSKFRFYSKDGKPIGGEHIIYTNDPAYRAKTTDPQIVALKSGRFAISSYVRNSFYGTPILYVSTFDAKGKKDSEYYIADRLDLRQQIEYDLEATGSGGFIIAFDNARSAIFLPQNGANFYVTLMEFDSKGNPIDGQIPILYSSGYKGTFSRSGLTLVQNGASNMFAAWNVDALNLLDGSGSAVAASQFRTSPPSIFGNSAANTIKGTNNRDVIQAGGGNDKIYAYAGDDTIRAGDGDDNIDAGDGNDRVFGGRGRDTIKGGRGADYFVFGMNDSSPSNPDVISDFAAAEGDKIDLRLFKAEGSQPSLDSDYRYGYCQGLSRSYCFIVEPSGADGYLNFYGLGGVTMSVLVKNGAALGQSNLVL